MDKKRHENIDLTSGLLMIQIIVMHILQFAEKYQNDIFSVIMHVSFFFMPWFYFKSGYFFKSVEKIDINYILVKSKKLLIPFVSFTIIGFIITFPFEIYEVQRPVWRILLSLPYSILRWGDGGAGNLPIWFLLSLFFALFSFAFLDKVNLKWLILLFPVIGFLIIYNKIALPLGLNNLFLAVFFMYIGNIFRKMEYTKYYNCIIIAAIVIYLITQYYCFSSLDFRSHDLLTGNYFIFVISSIAGIVVIYYFAKMVNFIKPINYIGKNSLIYFIAHWPIIILSNQVLKMFSVNTIGYIYAMCLTFVVFITMPFLVNLFNKKYKFLIGN